MNSPAGILLENRVGWGGIIASLSAARCNCSLNSNLSGVATLPFSTGLHSVLSLSETGPTRTVAFPCLPRTAPASASSRLIAGDVLLPAIYPPDVKQTCALYTHSQRKTLYVCWGNSQETPKLKAVRLLLYQSTDNYICTPQCNLWIHIYDRSMKCYQLLPNNERGLLVFTQHLKFFYYLYRNYFIGGGGKNLNLWPRQWHPNRFKLLSICLQSQCNAIITCFHGPRSHLACITKEKKLFYTRCIFFFPLCALL